jgi:hypothetical protein
MRTLTLAAAAAAALAAGAASAATSDTFGPAMTNWTETLSVDMFDGSLGTLTKATFKLIGEVNGSASGESLDAAPATVTLDLSAEIEATAGSLLLVTLPTVSESFGATAFDGTIDFGGTSGVAFLDRTAMDMDTIEVTDAAALALLTGPGTIDWTVSATGMSVGTGAGNLITQFMTNAGASIEVSYMYDAVTTPIPVPAALPMLVAGLAGLGALARRRRD